MVVYCGDLTTLRSSRSPNKLEPMKKVELTAQTLSASHLPLLGSHRDFWDEGLQGRRAAERVSCQEQARVLGASHDAWQQGTDLLHPPSHYKRHLLAPARHWTTPAGAGPGKAAAAALAGAELVHRHCSSGAEGLGEGGEGRGHASECTVHKKCPAPGCTPQNWLELRSAACNGQPAQAL